MADGLGGSEDKYVESTRLLLEKILRSIAMDADAVVVEAAAGSGVIVFTARVSELDVSKVIGEDGRTARALRTILSAAGRRHRDRFTLDIEELPRAAPEGRQGIEA